MFLGVSMGALNEGHLEVELENGVKAGGPNPIEVGFEKEPETLAIEDAVRVLLQGLGEDANREGLRKTPFRVAKALREGTKGYKQKVKDIVQGALFPEAGLENRLGQAGGVGGLVIVRDLDLFSYCESCLLPFQVKCHVGYVPSGQRVVGLSKLSRAADVFAKRLQEPERLAREICSALQQGIKPKGVAIVLQCRHIHFPDFESAVLESNHSGFAEISVSSRSGIFRNDETNNNLWDDFMNLLKFRDEIEISNCVDRNWCPSRCFSTAGPGNSAMMMTNAITSIIRSLGEDPSREELVQTPIRFVKWMMNFKNSNLEMNLRLNPLRSDGGEERMESELNLSFWSQCEHHLLPFYGFVHIGYFSGEGLTNRIGGKSLLQTIVHFYGFKLQVQERLTRQIAEAVAAVLGGDVVVVVEANHTCMISRGIEKVGSSTATIAVLGRFSSDSSARSMFLKSIPNFSSSSSSSSTGV